MCSLAGPMVATIFVSGGLPWVFHTAEVEAWRAEAGVLARQTLRASMLGGSQRSGAEDGFE